MIIKSNRVTTMRILVSLLILVLFVSSSSSTFIFADDNNNFPRGTWSDTARDLISTTQDDPNYRHVILHELLAASSSSGGNGFADAVCSRPSVMQCIGNPNDAKGSATSQSWPVQITIRQFNGTVHYEKLPKSTQILVIEESIIPVDVVDLMARLPNGIENVRFVRSSLVTSGGNVFSRATAGNPRGNNNNGEANENSNNKESSSQLLSSLTSISIEYCKIDDSLFETSWIPASSSLRSFTLLRSTFSSSSIAPLVANAPDLEEIRILSNNAPINFRELLTEISSRAKLQTIDFQAGAKSRTELEDAKKISSSAEFPKNLLHLRLSNLSLPELPRALPAKLTTLELPFNSIRTGGEALGDILAETGLEMFDFSNNTIDEFPKRLPTTIKRIRIASNRLKGKLDFGNLPRQLEEICIAHNEMSGGVDLSKLPSQLQVFDIAYNKFSGTINMREFPDSVRYVFLHFNEFTGRYDVSRLPLLSVKVLFGGNKWDSLIPRR